MTLAELRQLLAKRAAEMRALLKAAEDGSRDLTEEEDKRFGELEREVSSLEKRIKREERTANLERHLDEPDEPVPAPELGTPARPRQAPAVHVRENRGYSVVSLARALMSGDARQASVEQRASDEIAERVGRPPQGFFVPYRALLPLAEERKAIEAERRDITKATTGADLVGTDLVPQEFIELLRNESVVVRLGARVIPNLVGDVDIPRQIAAATATWLALETTDLTTDTNFDTDAVNLTPKTVGIRADMSRRMLKQSTPGIEEIVREDIRQSIGLAVDAGAISGTGASGQPTGIINSSPGGVTTLGALAWAHIVEFETDLGTANALRGRLAYACRSSVLGTMKTTLKTSGVSGYLAENGMCNGYPIAISEQIPADTLIFGNWAEVLVGLWGVLDLFGDPYTLGNRGGLVIRGFQDIDVALRHAASFSVASDL